MAGLREEVFNENFDDLLKDYLAESVTGRRDNLRGKLIKQCMPYVHKIARGLARRSSDPVDDLVQVGSMGLLKALDKYNPLAGSSFKTYATYLITGEIRHYLRDKSSVIKAPRQMYELYYRINQIVQRLADEYGRTPTDLEIAEALECPIEHIQNASFVDRRRNLLSLDQFVLSTDGSTGETQYIERLVDEKYVEYIHNQEDKLLVDQALIHLKDELKVVVEMTYYQDMSQMEIAKVLGISQMQVSRRLRKALDTLQELIHKEQVDAR